MPSKSSRQKNGGKSPIGLPKDPKTGQFLPGNSGGPGRPKGKRNKITVAMQDAVSGAMEAAGERVLLDLKRRIARRKNQSATEFEAIMLGLPPAAAYLLKQAEDNPAQFLTLAKQLMPTKIDVDVTLKADALMERVAESRARLAEMRADVAAGAIEVSDYKEVD